MFESITITDEFSKVSKTSKNVWRWTIVFYKATAKHNLIIKGNRRQLILKIYMSQTEDKKMMEDWLHYHETLSAWEWIQAILFS